MDTLLRSVSHFFAWLGQFIHDNPWPTTVITFFLLFFFVPWIRFIVKDALRSLGIKRLKFSGTEIEFGREDKLIVQRTLDESIAIMSEYRKKVDGNVDRLIRKTGLRSAFRETAAQIFEKQFGSKFADNMRATIHVQDFILEDRLYQMLDYYPSGGGAHRHFSHRRGIIGRVWRSQIPASAGFLIQRTAPAPAPVTKDLIAAICLEWGLTETEALEFKERPSYCCVPITDGHRKLGVFYMDSKARNFGWQNDIESKLSALEECCTREIEKAGIGKLLSEIESEMADHAPRRSLDG